MKSKLTELIRRTHQKIQPLTQLQKFKLRYGKNWRQIAYCQMTPIQKENSKYI